jgi:hypothetical protein
MNNSCEHIVVVVSIQLIVMMLTSSEHIRSWFEVFLQPFQRAWSAPSRKIGYMMLKVNGFLSLFICHVGG